MGLPTLILQKRSATSKSKEHSAAMEGRLNLRRQGDLDLDLWCCNQNKGLSRAVGNGCRAISKNSLLQEFQGWGQGFERGDRHFHKKCVKDRLPSIFAWRLYLLQTHPLAQKPWNTICWRWWGPEAHSWKHYCWIFEGRDKRGSGPPPGLCRP